jgi:hypothetical protein
VGQRRVMSPCAFVEEVLSSQPSPRAEIGRPEAWGGSEVRRREGVEGVEVFILMGQHPNCPFPLSKGPLRCSMTNRPTTGYDKVSPNPFLRLSLVACGSRPSCGKCALQGHCSTPSNTRMQERIVQGGGGERG